MYRWLICSACLSCLLLVTGPIVASEGLEAWRSEYQAIKLRAKTDVRTAYDDVQRLDRTMPSAANAADRVNLLNLQTRVEAALGRNELAEQHAREALSLAQESENRLGQIEAHINLLKVSINQGKIEQSVSAAVHAMELVNDRDAPLLRSETMFWLSMAYRRIGRMSESVNLALEALDFARDSGDPMALVYAHHGLALSFDQSTRAEEAYEHFEAMHHNARWVPSRTHEAVALQGMAATLVSMGKLSDAEHLLREAIGIHRSLNAPLGLNVGLFGLADLLRHKGRHAEIIPILDEVIAAYLQHPNRLGLWYSLNARSDAFLVLGDVRRAGADAEQAHGIARDIDQPHFLIESTRKIASIAAAQGDYARAYTLAQEAMTLSEQEAQRQTDSQMGSLVERYQLVSKQRQIDELNRRSERQAAEISQRTLQQRWLQTVLLSSLLLLTGTAYFLYRLRRYNLQLRGLAARLETVREEERKRIARDLHDELGQHLTAMRLEVCAIRLLNQDPESAVAGRVSSLNKLIDETFRVARTIAASLRPAALDMGGVSSLEWLAEEFYRRTGVVCDLDVAELDMHLSDKHLTAIFRIVQESLTNIARHASASKVTISLYWQGKMLLLEIADNGVGFDANRSGTPSFGLTGMRERVLGLGGEMQIASKPASGTIIRVKIPVAREEVKHDQDTADG